MSDLFSNFQAVQEIAEKNAGGGKQNGFLGYIYWPGKVEQGKRNEKIVRFLHDGTIVLNFHERQMLATGKPGDAVCRQSPAIENQADCPLCAQDVPYNVRGVGLAVQREETITGEGAQRHVVMSDKTVEDRDTKAQVPLLGTIKQGLSNFWNNLAPLSYRYGTVTGRDIQVTRVGSDTSTSYSFLPFDVEPDLDDLDKVLARYEKVLDGKSPQEVIMGRFNYMASDKYYEKNFGAQILKGGKAPVASTEGDGYSAQSSNGGVQENSGTSFAELKNRLSSYSPES